MLITSSVILKYIHKEGKDTSQIYLPRLCLSVSRCTNATEDRGSI